jgi:transcriptional regulator with XRE-family HTH domain
MTTGNVVRLRTDQAASEVLVDPTMRERGKRFEHAVREGMAQQGIANMRELADVTGSPPTTWYRWFHGYPPRRSSMIRIAHALKLTVDELMDPWENGPRVMTMTDEQFDAALARAAERVADLVVERLTQQRTGPTELETPERLQEQAEAAAEAEAQRQREPTLPVPENLNAKEEP